MLSQLLAAAVLINGVSPSSRSEQAQLEARVLSELNYARSQPTEYLRKLNAYKRRFVGLTVTDEASRAVIETEEGANAVEEAIRFVQASAAKAELVWDDNLAGAAAEHANEQSLNGMVGHEAADGSDFGVRMDHWQALQQRPVVAEIISYGDFTQEGVVRELIVDDGVADRGHRAEIFDASLHRAGVSCKPHPIYGMSCVIDLSG